MFGALGRLNVSLTAETANFCAAMDKAAYQAKKRMDDIQRNTRQVGRAMGIVLTAAATGFAFQMKKIIDDADELGKMSQKIGVSVQSLSAFRYAAQLAGTDFETLTKGIGRFSRVASDAANNLITAKRPFEDLSIEFKKSDGNLRDVEDMLLDVADKFSKMADGTKKAALAQELFGRAGVELIPFLNEGREGIARITAEAQKMGIIFDTKTAKAAEDFNDRMTDLKAASTGLFATIGSQLIPVLANYSQILVDDIKNTDGVRESTRIFVEGLKTLIRTAMIAQYAIQGNVNTLGDLAAIMYTLSENKSIGENLMTTLKGPFYWIKEAGLSAEKFQKVMLITQNYTKDAEELANKLQKNLMSLDQPISSVTKNIEDNTAVVIENANAQEKQTDKIKEQAAAIKQLNPLFQGLNSKIASAFEDAIVEGKKLQDVINGLIEDVYRLFIQTQVTKPLFNALLGEEGLISSFFAPAAKSAKGNVFNAGYLQAFARGGTINRPTIFPMANGGTGLAGEKGTEGIFPLFRTREGDLGVKGESSGGVQINIYAPPGSEVAQDRKTEGGMETINIYIDEAMAGNVSRPGSKTYKALKNSFGLGQKLISR